MGGAAIITGMVICAVAAFAVLVRLVRSGKTGLAATVLSVAGAVSAILFYATGKPFGVHPVLAMSILLVVMVPVMIGAGAGALLGWLLRRRDDHRAGLS